MTEKVRPSKLLSSKFNFALWLEQETRRSLDRRQLRGPQKLWDEMFERLLRIGPRQRPITRGMDSWLMPFIVHGSVALTTFLN